MVIVSKYSQTYNYSKKTRKSDNSGNLENEFISDLLFEDFSFNGNNRSNTRHPFVYNNTD